MDTKLSNHANEDKPKVNVVNNRKLIKIYYTALMTFLVITFADKLFQGLIHHSYIADLWLYTILWVAFVIQTTYAYIHIRSISLERYTTRALFSDIFDVFLEIFICAAIGSTCNSTVYRELNSYLFLSIPFVFMAVNQFYWYIVVDEFNPRAILCLSLLFSGMVVITISEAICPGLWNLVFIVTWHAITMAILRIVDKVPQTFEDKAKIHWKKITESNFAKKLQTYKNEEQSRP